MNDIINGEEGGEVQNWKLSKTNFWSLNGAQLCLWLSLLQNIIQLIATELLINWQTRYVNIKNHT